MTAVITEKIMEMVFLLAVGAAVLIALLALQAR